MSLEVEKRLKWQRLKPFEKFARMVEAHWDGIEAYCSAQQPIPLGFVEGLNNKIRALQRRAFGFRDQEYLRLKILTCGLPKLQLFYPLEYAKNQKNEHRQPTEQSGRNHEEFVE